MSEGLCRTLGERARHTLQLIDEGGRPEDIRTDVEAMLADLTAMGIADVPIVRGDAAISLDHEG